MYQGSTSDTRLKRKYKIYQEFYRDIDDASLRQNDVLIDSVKESEKWLIEIFDEEKSISEWASDDRCVVPRQTLYHRIIKSQMNPEDALTIPIGDVESVNHKSDVPSNRASLSWANVKEIRNMKLLDEVTNQDIADNLQISINIVNDVISGRTWKDDNYTSKTSSQGKTKFYDYHGEQLTLTQISNLCGVPKPTLDRRLNAGLSMDDATAQGRKEPKAYDLPEISRSGLTKEKVFEIRQDYKDGIKGKSSYEKHGLTKSRYMDIVLNRTWKEEIAWWKEQVVVQ